MPTHVDSTWKWSKFTEEIEFLKFLWLSCIQLCASFALLCFCYFKCVNGPTSVRSRVHDRLYSHLPTGIGCTQLTVESLLNSVKYVMCNDNRHRCSGCHDDGGWDFLTNYCSLLNFLCVWMCVCLLTTCDHVCCLTAGKSSFAKTVLLPKMPDGCVHVNRVSFAFVFEIFWKNVTYCVLDSTFISMVMI